MDGIALSASLLGAMGAEYGWLRFSAAERGPTPADYELLDSLASLNPLRLVTRRILPTLLPPITPGKGRYGKGLVIVAAGAAVVTTVADRAVRRSAQSLGQHESGAEPGQRRPEHSLRRGVHMASEAGGTIAMAAGGVAIATLWSEITSEDELWKRRFLPDLGTGLIATAAAIVGWDFIYYWNHRLMHEVRFMWAIHVPHHSSERFNLTTAVRQTVTDSLGLFVPYGLLCLVGIRPELVRKAATINLLHQYWIHTETIPKLGALETLINTPSHHRVHHGSNPQYLDRNLGSTFIVWDRLFGTFAPEAERVRYGLTEPVATFNPLRIMSKGHLELLSDLRRCRSWRERFSVVFRAPDWAAQHRATKLSGTPTRARRSSVAVARRVAALRA